MGIALDLINKIVERDIKTLQEVITHLDSTDEFLEKSEKLIDRLENHKVQAEQLQREFYQNDLPPIRSSEAEPSTQVFSTRFFGRLSD